ncbi:UNVERIFIED_CONTAM: hypothetical protein PYX00_011246 [Menopon gallinae]|uniref:Exocyst complex component Sec10-like alpha-helical bundle domain-containing protein n=1 Tax=Menopon gallinae TaxID=328185 RepID=A0AAW2H6E1_9NEOP
MVKITMNQLRDRLETPLTIMDNVVEINEENLHETEEALQETLLELEKIREALFFKCERLKAENERFREFSFESLCIPSQPVLEECADVSYILELQKEVQSYDLMAKVLKLRGDVSTNVDVFGRVFQDPEHEELEVFCFFLSESMLDEKVSEQVFELKHRTEQRIIEMYEGALRSGDVHELSALYRASFYLNRGHPLAKIFINNIEILKDPFFLRTEEVEVVDLDSYRSGARFTEFLDSIRDTYEKDLCSLDAIFFDAPNILQQINKRVFDDILCVNLDAFLEKKDPVVFLMNLKSAYVQVRDLCHYIQSLHPTFYAAKALEDIFSPYISLVPTKEAAAFDKLFDTLVYKKPCTTHYIILGEKLEPDYDNNSVFKKLLALFCASVERHETFHAQQQEKYFEHFFRRMNEFVSEVETGCTEPEKLCLVQELSNYYLVLKQLCKAKKIPGFEVFKSFVEGKMQATVEIRVRASDREIRKMFSSMRFGEYSSKSGTTLCTKKVTHFLQLEYNAAKRYIPGENSSRFIGALLSTVYSSFYRNMLDHTFTRGEAEVLCNDARALLSFVKRCASYASPNFEYLLEAVQLIAVSSSDLRIFFANAFDRIPDNEAKKILKCRSDYREIRNALVDIKGEDKPDASPEDRIKALETKIQTLMEVCGGSKKESGGKKEI